MHHTAGNVTVKKFVKKAESEVIHFVLHGEARLLSSFRS